MGSCAIMVVLRRGTLAAPGSDQLTRESTAGPGRLGSLRAGSGLSPETDAARRATNGMPRLRPAVPPVTTSA
jgi:hypothetical protein